MSEAELVLVGVGGGHGDFDAAHGGSDLGADFEEFGADGGACCIGELGMGETDAAECAD